MTQRRNPKASFDCETEAPPTPLPSSNHRRKFVDLCNHLDSSH